MRNVKEALLEMIKEKAYRSGEFKLSSGNTSQHYVNCKPVILNGRGLYLTATMLLQYVDTPVVAGLTLGADPLVAGVAMEGNLDGLIIRKEPKGHGTGAWIEGPSHEKGTKVTVLEDVVTTGGSSLKAVSKLREAGYEVERVVTIVDRKEYESFTWYDQEIELYSLFTIDDLA
tara:strand:- start:62 stop:580 length:519 start_codon:yes stop_codon:yes gene_type:complete